ncbi:hypothetical protein CRENBAI_011282 [Crenichthys baileyi]|uniref:Uncharacterized protein n=1 Tax=Crenichthys baileyi TaxID=28760 RepID=A0AAV9S0K0_9TELE
MSFLRRVVGHPLERVRSSAIGRGRSRPAALHMRGPFEVVGIIPDAPWTPSSGGFSRHVPPGRGPRGTAQDTLEGLCLLAGLGTAWAPPEELEEGFWGEGRLGVLLSWPPRPVPDKGKMTRTRV